MIDERVIYSTEILNCKLDYLPQFLSPSTNLYELNHLAQRLATLSEWELDCFEGMVMMDTIKNNYAPIPVDRLINMTHSMADCQIAYEAHDDQSLGLFYADNGFVRKLETLPESIFKWLDYGKIGKELREGEGGVFTPNGYVVQNGEIAQTYQSGAAIPAEKPDYTVLFKVNKGCFNDPDYDNGLTAFMKLPAGATELDRAVGEVGAASSEECVLTAADCIILQG
nr:antirestriction protein ArdA [uncultured Caproiciproducens sp.]